eukprot:3213303-Rhodomonas_salina.1
MTRPSVGLGRGRRGWWLRLPSCSGPRTAPASGFPYSSRLGSGPPSLATHELAAESGRHERHCRGGSTSGGRGASCGGRRGMDCGAPARQDHAPLLLPSHHTAADLCPPHSILPARAPGLLLY